MRMMKTAVSLQVMVGCVSNRWQLHASKLILRDTIDSSFVIDHMNVTVSTSPHNKEQCLDGIVTQGYA